MCGISGWFSQRALEPGAENRLREMMRAIGHRGPDADGTHCDRHAALGHTRLSIIDVDSGQQPMSSATGNTTIVFNGEIYNYRSLRTQCEDDGYQFRTNSDTEVILALYETHGIQAMSRLRGMFAFVLRDHEMNTGWLVRDPLGIKPLFFAREGDGCLVFASEAKAIFASGFRQPSLDVGSLHLLMNFRYLPGNQSLFEGVEQLPAGHAMCWEQGGSTRLVQLALDTVGGADDTVAAIKDSVGHHMVSDVEVGAYLSGGIDSATIVSLAGSQSATTMNTFTLDVGDDPKESRNAARTAKILGVNNIQGEESGADTRSSLKKVLWHLEVPKINAYQVFELAGLASQHVKVCLSGLGGDELFLGYNAHGIMNKARQAAKVLPGPLSASTGGLMSVFLRNASSAPWGEKERASLMLQSLGNWPRVYGLLRNVWDTPSLRQKIYGPRLLDQKLPSAFDYIEGHWPQHSDPVMAMAEYERNEKMVNDMLWQEDRLSMAHGLEVRVPFVDKELLSYTKTMDRKTLMPHGQLKGHMRNAVGQFLPQEILQRPKSGFQVDAATFYKEHLQPLAKEVLSASKLRDAGLFNPEFVRQIEALPARKRFRWHFFMLYMMVMTHLWMDVFDTK